jgi:hypothetical protein
MAKKKVGNFENLVQNILDNIDTIAPKGMLVVEVIGALEAAKLILSNKMTNVQDLNSFIEELLNDKA